MKLVFNPLTGKLDYVSNSASDVGLDGLATSITAGKTLTLAAVDDYTVTLPATGTAALGAGTLTSITTNDVTGSAHTHAITGSTGLVGNGTAQYQVLTAGATPFAAAWSGFLLDGTTGGKTVFAVTNTKTLTLTAADDYTLTIPESMTVAGRNVANTFTATQTINVGAGIALDIKAGSLVFDNSVSASFKLLDAGSYFQLQTGGGSVLFESDFSGNAYVSSKFGVGARPVSSLSIVKDGTQITGTNFYTSVYLANAAENKGFWMGYDNSEAGVGVIGPLGASGKFAFWSHNGASWGERGRITSTGFWQFDPQTTITSSVLEVLRLQATISTASTGGAAGFGAGLTFYSETATDGTNQLQALIASSWVDAANATRKAKLALSAYDTAVRLGLEIEASGSAAKIGFYGTSPVVQGTALTTQLTTITHTAPGTPDYAIQDMVDVSLGAGWAFADHDEANTVLSTIANLQARVAELETRLGSASGVGLFA